MFEYIVKKELGDSVCVNCFGTWGKNYSLRKAMVDHDHQRIEAARWGKISDKINRQLLEGKDGGGGDRGKRRGGRVGNNFILLAYSTAQNEF